MRSFLIALALGAALLTPLRAQADPPQVVGRYQDLLTGYLNDDDIEKREEIDNLLRGGQNKCYISNVIGNAVARERNLRQDRLHSDTYHNQLEAWHSQGVLDRLTLSNITWQKNWEEPRLKIGANQPPVYFVSADVNTTGTRPFKSSDLFFVQNGHIVSIEDLGSGGLGNAMRLYNEKKYDQAFALFNSIASTNRSSLRARYYTAVMLITGKGCKNINKTVRDQDAAWLGLSGYLTGDEDLTSLALKFKMKLPFSEAEVTRFPASYDGRRIIKKGDKFGIIDNSGRMVLPFRKGDASPISGHGIAVVRATDNRRIAKGIIDSSGNQIVPYEYDAILPYTHDGNLIAIKNGYLIVLTTTGTELKKIPGAFSGIGFTTTDGHVFVKNGDANEVYNFEGQLVLGKEDFDSATYNKLTGELRLTKGKGPSAQTVRIFDTDW